MAKIPEHLVHESHFRGANIVEKRAAKRIVIAGVGALGSHLLDDLVVQGYRDILIIDKDRVEQGNFGTQRFGFPDIGTKKATQAKNNLFRRLKVPIDAHDKELTKDNVGSLVKSPFLVIDLFDNVDSRRVLKDYCAANKIACLHAGMSTDGFAEVQWNEGYYLPESDKTDDGKPAPCEYPLAANLVSFTVAIVCEIVNQFIDNGQKRSAHFTLKDMHINFVET